MLYYDFFIQYEIFSSIKKVFTLYENIYIIFMNMNRYENNAYFWQKIDALYLSGDFIETHHRGEGHPIYPELKFPLTYGTLKIDDYDNQKISAFKGSKSKQVEAIALCADILNKDVEIKFLIGLSEEEEEMVLKFLDQTEFQKSVLIRRGNDIPYWNDDEVV